MQQVKFIFIIISLHIYKLIFNITTDELQLLIYVQYKQILDVAYNLDVPYPSFRIPAEIPTMIKGVPVKIQEIDK